MMALFMQMICKPLFFECALRLNNNPVLNGGIKFTCIYLVTPNPPACAVRIKMELPTLPIQTTISSMVKLPLGTYLYKISQFSSPQPTNLG